MVKKENSSLIELTLDEKKLFIQYWGGGDTTCLDYSCTRDMNNSKNKNTPTHPSHSPSLTSPIPIDFAAKSLS